MVASLPMQEKVFVMFLKKSVIPMMFTTLALGVVCLPRPALAQDAAQAVKARLSVEVVQSIQQRPEDALRILMTYAFRCSNDGVVTKENIAVTKSIDRAAQRVRVIQPMLKMDLDADGDVSRSEFESYARLQDPNSRVRSELHWGKSDENDDGVVTIAEMLAAAQIEIDSRSGRSNGRRNLPLEILMMDVDGDGQVTVAEIRAVVGAISN